MGKASMQTRLLAQPFTSVIEWRRKGNNPNVQQWEVGQKHEYTSILYCHENYSFSVNK